MNVTDALKKDGVDGKVSSLEAFVATPPMSVRLSENSGDTYGIAYYRYCTVHRINSLHLCDSVELMTVDDSQ